MNDLPQPAPRVAVIGGGITGLAAAHRLVELRPDCEVVLLEAGDRLGGVLQTVHRDGFAMERSADNFITNVPWALDLCRRVGLEDQLLQTNDAHRQAFVVHRGRLRKIPEGFLIMAPSRIGPVLATPILSWRAKLRLACERFVPRCEGNDDESLAGFATRRLGRETYERIVQPLVGGIYTGDPKKLSVQATMPRFVEMERQHGSLTRGMRRGAAARRRAEGDRDKSNSGARYSMFVTPRGGLSNLVAAIAGRLPAGTVRLNRPVERITRRLGGGWSIAIGGDAPEQLTADAVIVATPAPRAARILAAADAGLSAQLERIAHAPCAVVSLGYWREQIGHPLDGFGFVVPQVEGRRILSGSFSSVKYAGRAPQGCHLLRVFIGGACQAELAALPEQQLRTIACEELAELLDVRGAPLFCDVTRWANVMPQYHVGHRALVADIESRAEQLGGLQLAGNAYHGVGIPHCIHSGETAAGRITEQLRTADSPATRTRRPALDGCGP